MRAGFGGTRSAEDAVIAAIRPGFSAIINLTGDQRALLTGDQEGLDALSLLGHVLHARDSVGERGTVPLCEGFLRRAASRAGIGLGRNAVRRARRRLASATVIEPAGSYRQKYRNTTVPTGFRVPLWNVKPVVWIGNKPRRFAGPDRPRSAIGPASVATWAGVKRLARRRGVTPWRRPWWEHPLFGTPDGRPPPATREKKLGVWKSFEHAVDERRRENHFYKGSAE